MADGDVRYVPEEDSPDGSTFCSVGHESRYLWARDHFQLTGARVLDYGCGSGYGAALLAEKAERVLGLDISPTSIAYASERYVGGGTAFGVADLEHPGLPAQFTERFDFIFSFDVVEHTERYFTFMENVAALLAPGGTAVIGCPNRLETFDLNLHWNEHHIQEFTPAQLHWLASLYFNQCDMMGQDFVDKSKRERLQANVSDSRKKGMQRLMWKWRRSLEKRIPWLRSRKRMEAGWVQNHDIRFFPMTGSLDTPPQAFGLLAICRSPKESRPGPKGD